MLRSVSCSRRLGSLHIRWLRGRHYAVTSQIARITRFPVSTNHKPLTVLSCQTHQDDCYRQRLKRRSIHSSTGLFGNVVPFNLPDVGEAIMTVELKEWLVKPGDQVSMGDAVCEVQSDKSAVTIYVPYDGVVKELMYEVDDIATKGKPLMMVEVEGEVNAEEGSAVDAPPPSPPTEAVDVLATPAVRRMADELNVNLNDVQGTGKDGRILKEDLLNHVETETSSLSDSSDEEGMTASPFSSGAGGKALATPAVRRVAKEWGVSLSDVQGTGESGRILKEDILRHVEAVKAAAVAPPSPPPTPSQRPPVTPSPAAPVTPLLEDRTVPVKGFKAVMVRTMTASGQVPQFGYSDEVDMTELVHLRGLIRERLLEKGIRFSFMPVIIKALSMALYHYPILNATVDAECTTITEKVDHNIGVAMDTAEGLVVPNVKQVQNKTVHEIASELNRLHSLGLAGQLTPPDIVGGTFSLSNIGAIGGTYTKPMVLPPEVAIGAFGKVQVLPRFDSQGHVTKAHIMHVTWSADHRVIDGATIARFSNLWKSYLENPASMILDLK